MDSPMDARFHSRLRELITDHKVDTILEEASGLPPKSCVELLLINVVFVGQTWISQRKRESLYLMRL
jgi:hypothetical protein